MSQRRRRSPNEGTLFYREARQLWCARITLPNGKVKEVNARMQAACKRKWEAAKRAAAAGLPAPSDRLKVGPYVQQWLADQRGHLAPNTFVGYEVRARLNIIPVLGKVPLAQLEPRHVRELLGAMRAAGKAARTIQYTHAVLRAALHQAEREGLVQRNVAALVKPPKVERPEVQPFSQDDARRFLRGVPGDRLEALYVLAASLGLRQGELLGLAWADVDLDGRHLHVRQQLQKVDSKLTLRPLKTHAKGRRTIDLPDALVAQLRAHRARQREQRLAAEYWQESDLVFTTGVGTPFSARNVHRAYRRLLTRIGLPPKRFHDLRHTAASLLLAQGVPLHEVSKILGHSGVQITADTYGHLATERRREIADGMDQWLQGAQ
jgi:integrase